MPVFEIVVIFLLILLNGFFAMSELALVSARRARLQGMAEDKVAGARAALKLIEEPTRFLSTVQIGITLVGILAGAYSGATLSQPLAETLAGTPLPDGWAYPVAVGIVVAAITYFSLVVGELVPKRIAMNNAERIAVLAARPMSVLARIGAPLVWLLRGSTDIVLKVLRVPPQAQSTVTEEEVKTMIAEGTESGVFETVERDMIEGVLRLADRSVRSVMTPRVDVVWIDLDDDMETIGREIRESGHSRFPVARRELDQIEGVVQTKDLLSNSLEMGTVDIEACIKQPLVVHDRTPVLKLLEIFRATSIHLAIVVDEYGSVEGIVTSTDILTAIAGDLPEGVEGEDQDAVQRPDGSWLLDAMLSVHEVERRLGISDMRSDGDYDTLAGFMLEQFDRIPTTGESFSWRDRQFEVVDMDGRRIDKVLVSAPTRGPEHDASET